MVDNLQTDVVVASVSTASPLQPTNRPIPGSPQSLDRFKPTDIAHSLTVIEGESYAKISQADYVNHLRGTVSRHIEFATKINNRLVNWVKNKVLRSSSYLLKRRNPERNFLIVARGTCRSVQSTSGVLS